MQRSSPAVYLPPLPPPLSPPSHMRAQTAQACTPQKGLTVGAGLLDRKPALSQLLGEGLKYLADLRSHSLFQALESHGELRACDTGCIVRGRVGVMCAPSVLASRHDIWT